MSLTFTSHMSSPPVTVGESSVLPSVSTEPLLVSVSFSHVDRSLRPLGMASPTQDVSSASAPNLVSVTSPASSDPYAYSSSHVPPCCPSTES